MINIKSGIYSITNKINGKRYIGSAVDFASRWRIHKSILKNGKHHSLRLQNSYNKHGINNFCFEKLEFVEKIEIDEVYDFKKRLLEREQYWMDYYKSYDAKFGYNINIIANSRLGVKCSRETIENSRLSKARKLNWELVSKIREEYNSGDFLQLQLAKKYSVARTTINSVVNNYIWFDENYIKNRILSEKTKKQISIIRSESHKGKVAWNKGLKLVSLSEEQKRKIGDGNRGKIVSEETKQKMSLSQSGSKNVNAKFTFKKAEEVRELYSTNIYSQRELAEKYEVSQATINGIINNKRWTILEEG